MECHFEGTAAVQQPGKKLYQFQPGEKLSDYIHYFLLKGNQPAKPEALSQMEALSLSTCKQKSGDKMSCLSCHDPHYEPSDEERTAYYRAKCLACHGEKFGVKHHANTPDCTACHMPSLPSKEVAHTQATDHQILRRPRSQTAQLLDASAAARLVAFPAKQGAADSDRDLGLAWENLALRGVEGASANAEHYLQKAVAEDSKDAEVLAALAYIEQTHGKAEEAKQLYERAIKLDPLSNDALTNLGVLEAGDGDLGDAIELWQKAFSEAPYRSAIGMNLAMAFCDSGQTEKARRYAQEVLDFNPDFATGRELLKNLNADPAKCKL
jgi:Flp pilus assembly protein TadD